MLTKFWKTVTWPSTYFTVSEMQCRCKHPDCNAVFPDTAFLKLLDEFRSRLGVACPVSSGSRCRVHNKNVGGSKNSAHVYGRAVDIRTGRWSPYTLRKALLIAEELGFQGIGEGHGILHLDMMHAYRLRWDYDFNGKAVNFRPLD